VTPLLLGALALVFTSAAPRLLLRVPALRRTPASTLLLWQSVALAAVLSALGAGLAVATHDTIRREPGPFDYAVAAVAFALTGLVLARLLLSGHRLGTELRELRNRHRERVDLVAGRGVAGGVVVVDHPLPIAYCVPGMTQSRIVMSSGALDRLQPSELDAVLAHERAHLSARHDLVLEAFGVLARAFPRGVSTDLAVAEVGFLVEVVADQAAVKAGSSTTLARALVAIADARAPGGALGATDTGLAARIGLLATIDRSTRAQRVAQAIGVQALAVAVVTLPTAYVVWPWLSTL
jgi:beta-lactamase regulating signal transducer with metallopeptidase domain